MAGYWSRHRLLLSVIFCVVTAIVAGLLFAFPYITQQASDYNSQSIYKNSEMDFIAPEPAYEQVEELAGTNGIGKCFPFYLTKTQVTVNGTSRTGTVLLSDQFQNIDITMYNDDRLIEKATEEPSAPILVDWQFCHDTGAKVGDKVSFTINGTVSEFEIYAIYETNSVYDGGAVIAQISTEQADGIRSNSKNGGYSGVYIAADDYNTCRTYLTTDYRPLGRLKDRDSFDSDEQYQIHYDAIMSAGYANEITDFRVRESTADTASGEIMIWLGAALIAVLSIAFNIVMAKRGCEKVYFAKHCIPKGQEVKPYYKTAFVFETVLQIVLFAGVLIVKFNTAELYIPKAAMDIKLIVIPAAIVFAEIVCLVMNNSMVAKMTKKAKRKKQFKRKVGDRMKTSGVKLHLNQKIAAAYTSVFLVIVLLLTIVVAISTAADLTQIDSFLKSNYVYSVTVPSTVADNAYLQYNAGISFTVSNDAKAGVNAEVVMQTADAQYTDLVHWNTTRLKKDGIAISQNIASSNGIEIGDNLYSKNIIDGEIHKYTVEAILPAVTYIRGMKYAFHNDGIIIMGYDEQYASSITHKSIVFTAAPIEDLVSQCSSVPENIIYKDDEIDSAFASIAPYMAVYLMSIAVSMVVFILFFVKKIAHNFRRLIMLGFEKDALNKAYCFTISKYALFAIIGTVLVSTIAFGCKTFCVATITPVVCVMAVELVATAVTIAISNRQLWRK